MITIVFSSSMYHTHIPTFCYIYLSSWNRKTTFYIGIMVFNIRYSSIQWIVLFGWLFWRWLPILFWNFRVYLHKPRIVVAMVHQLLQFIIHHVQHHKMPLIPMMLNWLIQWKRHPATTVAHLVLNCLTTYSGWKIVQILYLSHTLTVSCFIRNESIISIQMFLFNKCDNVIYNFSDSNFNVECSEWTFAKSWRHIWCQWIAKANYTGKFYYSVEKSTNIFPILNISIAWGTFLLLIHLLYRNIFTS